MPVEAVETSAPEELRAVVRAFLEAKAPVRRTLALMEETEHYDHSVWRQMGDQLALQGLIVPEDHGGQGFGFEELAVALVELGRTVYSGPFLSSALLAPSALVLSGDAEACAEHLPSLASGERIGVLAVFEPDQPWAWRSPATDARRSGGDWLLRGRKTCVIDGANADLLIVSADCDGAPGLFLVEPGAAGVELAPVSVLDLTRPIAELTLSDAPARRIETDDVAGVLEGVEQRALAGLASEQAGGAAACLEMTVEYVSERHQFGRPVGSYQAVRHRCADMLIAVRGAELTARNAARAIDAGDPDLAVAVGLAKSQCSEAFLRVAGDTIQLHGGIGFTWEHPAHVYFKRAKSTALLFGDAKAHRDRLAPALLNPSRIKEQVLA